MTLPEYVPGVPLVLEPPMIHKEAAEKVPNNSAMWPTVIMRHLAEEYPFVLQGTDAEPIIQKQQPEDGVALGAIVVRSQPQQARPSAKSYGSYTEGSEGAGKSKFAKTGIPLRTIMIPALIENFELHPLDVFVTDEDEWFPLTEKRFSDIMFRPTPFIGTESRPQGSPIGDRTQVPPEMAFGYGSRGGISGQGKFSSATGTLLHTILEKAPNPDGFPTWKTMTDLVEFMPNRVIEMMRRRTQRHAPTGDDYMDVAQSILPVNVMRIMARRDGHYDVVEVSDSGYLPRKRLLSKLELDAEYERKVQGGLDSYLNQHNGDIVITTRRPEEEREPLALDELRPDLYELNKSSMAHVASSRGGFHLGRLFADVRDFDGHLTDLRVFTDGTIFGCQPMIVGDMAGPLETVKAEENKDPVMGDHGMFVYQPEGGGPEVTMPFQVLAHKTVGRGYGIEEPKKALLVQPYLGNEAITLCPQAGIDRIFSATGASDGPLASYVGGAIYYIPDSYIYLQLGRETALQYDKDQFASDLQSKIDKEIVTWPVHNAPGRNDERGSITLSNQTDGSYKMEGELLEQVSGKATMDGINRKDCLFLLLILGFSLDGAKRMVDKSDTIKRVVICNARPVQPMITKTAELLASRQEIEEVCALIRVDLTKEAANFGDSPTVDAMLSLGFVTPETINEFVEKLPIMQESEKVLAQMLFYARVGMNELPEAAIKNGMRALNQAIEAIEYLESMGRAGRAPGTVPSEKEKTYQEI